MSLDPRTPVLIGAGQALDRDTHPATAKHPVALMAEAVTAAFSDAAIAAPTQVDSVRVVRLLSWKYTNTAHALASACGITRSNTARHRTVATCRSRW